MTPRKCWFLAMLPALATVPGLLLSPSVWAASARAEATASASATIVSPALVDADAAAQLLLGSSIGSLALRIPGSGGGGGEGGDGSGAASGGEPDTGPGLTQLAELLDNGDGTLQGGVGASLSLREGADSQVEATVAYN